MTRQKKWTVANILNFLSVTFNAAAFFLTIWIVAPAPFYNIWLLSVLVGEWSLAFGTLAIVGIVFGLIARFLTGGKFWLVSFTIGGLAFLFSVCPFLRAYSVAREQNISLSLRYYLRGFQNSENKDSETKTIDSVTHIIGKANGVDLKLDAYLPPPSIESNGAAVIVVHGGSWNAGERNDFPQWNRWLAAHGYAVFDVDYRLAPQPNYLTATGDVKCAVLWVKQHAADFKVSADRIAVLGRSAGGHLALLAAFSAGDSRLPPSCSVVQNNSGQTEIPINKPSENVRAVVSFYAPTDLLWSYENPANPRVINGQETLRRFLGGSPHESVEMRERFTIASPVTHVNPKTPPTLLIHGGRDQLVRDENAKMLGGKLAENNVPHELLLVPYAQHGFDYNFYGWGSQIVHPVLLGFLDKNTNERSK